MERPPRIDDRKVKIAEPAWYPMTEEELFDPTDGLPLPQKVFYLLYQHNSFKRIQVLYVDPKIGEKLLMDHFKRQGKLTPSAAIKLIQDTEQQFRTEETLLTLAPPYPPLYVVGDLHGQFYDLISFFEMCPAPWDGTKWLFLGDYVDRGSFSCEIVLFLFSLKLRYPDQVYLLRGNHECRVITNHFQFKKECKQKYSEQVYNEFMWAFDAMPLGALLTNSEGRYLCVHAGIGPSINTLDDILSVDRFKEIPKQGAMCELVWSDPLEDCTANGFTADDMKDWWDAGFMDNPTRGCGAVYGYKALNDFLVANQLKGIIRAHDVQKQGYLEHTFLKPELEGSPPCVTLFSAPNYCGHYGNKAAVMVFDESRFAYEQFDSTDSAPYCLPKALSAVTYSLPFVVEKLTDVLLQIMKVVSQAEDKEAEESDQTKAKWLLVRKKVVAVSKVQSVLKAMAQDNQTALKLGGLAGEHTALDKFQPGIVVDSFEKAKEIDQENEVRPDMDVVGRYKSQPQDGAWFKSLKHPTPPK